MHPLSLSTIAAVVSGKLADVPDPDVQVSEPAVFDSREAVPGSLFIALKGKSSDGHDYAASAIAQGAVAALATRPLGVPAIVVDDVLQAFARLGHHLNSEWLTAKVVGITGSAGKTSTKDFIAQVLPSTVVATPQSFNNEIGLPLTITMAQDDTDYLVLEMGARHIGDIRDLTRIARPDISVVTNVGTAHVGEFGGRDNIAKAKGEIVEALEADGLAVLNADDERVLPMRNRTRAQVVTYGISEEADIRATELKTDGQGRASYTLVTPAGSARVELKFVGDVQVHNSLAAAAIGIHTGLTAEEVADRLSTALPRSRWRMETTTRADGVTIVNDAYNANPSSMPHSLDALAAMSRGQDQRSIAVLGRMNELGADSRTEHTEIGRYAATLGLDRIILVGGEEARWMLEGANDTENRVVHVPDADTALELLHTTLQPGDVVLVKASRGVQLQNLAERLLHPNPPAQGA
ncbi:UDP-N-acetylmuramoyl-tripeptide--D-alanyl-D-alanine ligase [Streptomyces sp. NPDC048410]|uniref:UDP-N-acetylmuramoyl-tripeptide--D-alanyl-D- alanine ligase n=1 Tax=Streptomyces sp. NPDC048410 TaxID=3365545 RepID=UPI00371F55B7